MIPLSVVLYEPGAGGVPPTNLTHPFAVLRKQLDRYEQAISAVLGFESMRCTMRTSLSEAIDWFNRLMYSTIVYDLDARTAWEGYLETVEVSFGDERRSMTIDGLSNAVTCLYGTVLGTQGVTSPVTDALSINRYGRREATISLGHSRTDEAIAFATKELARRRMPKPKPSSTKNVPVKKRSADLEVTLLFKGWYTALDWLLLNIPTTSSEDTLVQVKNILTAYNAVNPFFASDYRTIVGAGIPGSQLVAKNTTARAAIEDRLKVGSAGNQRLAYGVYENRQFHVKEWSGDTTSNITYRTWTKTGNIYRTTDRYQPGLRSRAYEPLWMVRPDAIYETTNLVEGNGATDSLNRFYVERVTCTLDAKSMSATLEPASSDSLDALLARVK